MRVSILETGKLPENLEKKFGDYPKMFSDLFNELEVSFCLKNYDLKNDIFPKKLDNTDLWLITGSSHGVYEKIEWISKLKILINKIYMQKTPMMGICFGHQIIAEAFGGRVEKSAKGWGVGVHKYQRKLNPEWTNEMGDFFSGYTSHQDQVVFKPKNAFSIYGSNFCPHSILCYDDIEKPRLISIQSHPEFKKDCLEMIINGRLGKTINKRVGNEGLKSLNNKIDNKTVFKTLLNALKVI